MLTGDRTTNDLKEIESATIDRALSIIKELSKYIIVANESDIPVKFSDWRKYRGFSLKQVEVLTGVSNSYISQLETGKIANPSFTVVAKLCKCYSVRVVIN